MRTIEERAFDLYKPAACTWQEALIKANEVGQSIGAKRLIELRVAYAGCFVAKYYMGSTRSGSNWIDNMKEVKVYDNTPYLKEGL